MGCARRQSAPPLKPQRHSESVLTDMKAKIILLFLGSAVSLTDMQEKVKKETATVPAAPIFEIFGQNSQC